MSIIAKYKFNQTIYENFIPEFNGEFTNYTITDEVDTDGFTIRTYLIGNRIICKIIIECWYKIFINILIKLIFSYNTH